MADVRARYSHRGAAAAESSAATAAAPGTAGTDHGQVPAGDGSGAPDPESSAPAPAVDGAAPLTGDDASAAEARPCDMASDAPGVTDDTITVGAISSLSGPVPGIGSSGAAAARAYVAYRNATGGVCGRQIELREADDGSDNGQYRSIAEGLSRDVLALVGGFSIGDVGGVDVIERTALPVVNSPSSDATTALPTAFDLNPPFADPDAVIGKYRWLRDHGAQRVAVSYLAVDQSRAEARLQQRLMEAAGMEIVDVHELPVPTFSFDGAARRVANSEADYLFFIGDTTSNGSMAKAVEDTGYELRFAEYFVYAYETAFVELAGSAAEGAITWLRALPTAESGGNAEAAAFVEWMGRVAPNDPRDAFAADSWVSAKAFFDSLEALGGPISREAVVAQLASVGTYDAGGMYGPIELGAEQTKGCVVAMQVRDGQWQRLVPDAGFLC